MKFLLDILGMTNNCNIRCSYCDWEMTKIKPLTHAQVDACRINLLKVRLFAEQHFPEYQMVEYAGGEPFVYPEICEQVLDIFQDKWIRFITNGTLVDGSTLDTLRQHGRTILAVSLDGSDSIQNDFRFHGNERLLTKVIDTVDATVDREIPLMILCTLSKCNIDGFFDFVEWLEKRYSSAIQNGLLVLPAHSVFSYTIDNGTPSQLQVERFANLLSERVKEYQLLSRIESHYQILVKLMLNHTRVKPCSVFRWAVSLHMRDVEIINGGRFHGFGCGMRGNFDLGVFDLRDSSSLVDFEKKVFDKNIEQLFFKTQGSYNKCQEYCFVDWVAVDKILSNDISLSDASDWFVLFRDPDVIAFVQKYIVSGQATVLCNKVKTITAQTAH